MCMCAYAGVNKDHGYYLSCVSRWCGFLSLGCRGPDLRRVLASGRLSVTRYGYGTLLAKSPRRTLR